MTADAISALVADAANAYGVHLSAAQCAKYAEYVTLVLKWQRVVNLTGSRDALTFARAHILDCLSLVPLLADGPLLDVGSGAGLPGVVLALAAPERPVTLLEPRAKRARFLTQTRIELGLERVEVVEARVEAHRPHAPYRYIVTRAVWSLADFLRATRHLHAPGTTLLAMKGVLPAAETAALGAAAATLESTPLEVPGHRDRQVVAIDCARLAAAEARARLVP